MSYKQRRAFWPSLAFLGLTLATIGLVSVRSKPRIPLSPAKPESQSATSRTAPEFKQRLRVWVHGGDMRPRIIRAWPGKAVLVIANDGRRDLSLQVARVVSAQKQLVSTISLSARSKRSQQELTLDVGEYVLYDEARPDTRLKLLVEPRP